MIIWQIKDLKLSDDYTYNQRDVIKNLRQLVGARRQLFKLLTPVALENTRRTEEIFDPAVISDVYLISLLMGEGEAYSSLMKEYKNQEIIMFTGAFIEIILYELDTISDFIDYIQARRDFLNQTNSVWIDGGEEELLGFYLLSGRDFSSLAEFDFALMQGGYWEELNNRPEYQARNRENTISYGWDYLIEQVHKCKHKDYEVIARQLSQYNRFHRRLLSMTFKNGNELAHERAKTQPRILQRRIMTESNTTFCFLYYNIRNSIERKQRQELLTALCYITRDQFHQNSIVVGIATEATIQNSCTYDFCYLDFPDWDNENHILAMELQKETGFLTNPNARIVHADEYPTQLDQES